MGTGLSDDHTFKYGGILFMLGSIGNRLEPELHHIHHGKASERKTIIIIPGILTAQEKPNDSACDEKNRNKVKYLDPLLKSGWDGDVHYLWWNSSTMSHFTKDLKLTILFALGLAILLFMSQYILATGIVNTDYYILIEYTREYVLLNAAIVLGFALLAAAVFIIYKYIIIHKRASRTAQDYLPQAINRCFNDTEESNIEKYQISFLAHSMGSYVLHKWVKKYNDEKWIRENKKEKYRIQNPIKDIIFLGAAVCVQEKVWFQKNSLFTFGNMINVYNPEDRILFYYEIMDRLRLKRSFLPSGSGRIREAQNISIKGQTNSGEDPHYQYDIVFEKEILKYDGDKWNIDYNKVENAEGIIK